MRKAKRIEIIYADSNFWYRDLVGCKFYVVGEVKEAYHVIVGGVGKWFLVEKKHAKVIEWFEPSYHERQAEWIKENNIKVGDKVWFMYSYEGYQEGFNYDSVAEYSCRVNNAYTIESIASDHIKLEGIPYPMPYFAFEPVTDVWQPCETVKEKLLFIGKKVRRKSDGARVGMITGIYDFGFRLGSGGMEYASSEEFLENYELLDGSPIGVNKVKELLG